MRTYSSFVHHVSCTYSIANVYTKERMKVVSRYVYTRSYTTKITLSYLFSLSFPILTIPKHFANKKLLSTKLWHLFEVTSSVVQYHFKKKDFHFRQCLIIYTFFWTHSKKKPKKWISNIYTQVFWHYSYVHTYDIYTLSILTIYIGRVVTKLPHLILGIYTLSFVHAPHIIRV